MRALLIGLAGLMMALTLGCGSDSRSAQQQQQMAYSTFTPPTPAVAPGKPAPATPTPILVPKRHPPTPTPGPTAVPTPMARITADELIAQIQANPKRYKRGDTLIVVGFLKKKWYYDYKVYWDLEAPDGWEVYFGFPEKASPSANLGDMVEVQIQITSVDRGVSAKNASVIKVTKQ